MADFYELDFLPVHRSNSGDAIIVRYQIGENWQLHLVDGGYASTTDLVTAHIKQFYGTTHINRVVVTHPDKDHAEGLAGILKAFTVDELWMMRPWQYAAYLLPGFARFQSAERLADRLRKDYPYIAELERIALERGIEIREPIQGQTIGPFKVLAPTFDRWVDLIRESEKTPQRSIREEFQIPETILGAVMRAAGATLHFIKDAWGSEKFSSDPTSVENEMSVVQFAAIAGDRILLTGDAGRDGMTEAADYLEMIGVPLPGIKKFQAPHHGGRRNLSSEILDRWVGPPLPALLPEGQEVFTAMISSAKEDEEHPRKAVERALMHRGGFVATTEDGPFRVARNAPARPGWTSMTRRPYPDEQEN